MVLLSDYFGYSVSISDDTIVVGAYGDASNQGAAYVFTRSGTSWTQQEKLLADDGAASDYFGYSVSISGDTIVVGSLDDDDGSASGSAYVFVTKWNILESTRKLTAGDASGNHQFGWSVSISGDSIVVGSHKHDDDGYEMVQHTSSHEAEQVGHNKQN